jgi:hypothetical protein
MTHPDARTARSRVAAIILCLFALFVVGLASAIIAQDAKGPRAPARAPARELWFFFSPAARPLIGEVRALAQVLARHPEVELRPVFLAEDWRVLKNPGEDLAQAIKELRALRGAEGGIRVWDDEGLSLAREIGIARLPAYAVLEASARTGVRKAKVAVGHGAKIEELLRCR